MRTALRVTLASAFGLSRFRSMEKRSWCVCVCAHMGGCGHMTYSNNKIMCLLFGPAMSSVGVV